MDDGTDAGTGLTRRQLLRRGALATGVLVWAVPAVQVVMPAAQASPGSDAVLAVHHHRQIQSEPGTLPFTGADIPIRQAIEVGAGLSAVGAVLAALKRRAAHNRNLDE